VDWIFDLRQRSAGYQVRHNHAFKFMRTALTFSICVVVHCTIAHAQVPTISVGPNVQVSVPHKGIRFSETIMCAHPTDPNHLMGVAQAHPGVGMGNRIFLAGYVSHDGGKTWSLGMDTHNFTNGAGDPACAFGRDGSAYFSVLLFEALGATETQLDIYRSSDAGKTWSGPTLASGSIGIDRAYIVVDNSGGKFDGRVYANSNMVFKERGVDDERMPAGLGLFRSMDKGVTFGHPVRRNFSSRDIVNHNGNMVVLSDGTVGWLFTEIDIKLGQDELQLGKTNTKMRFLRSEDGGETLTPAVTISDVYYSWTHMDVAIPSLAADATQGKFRDRIYAAWVDGKSGYSRVFVAYSSDKGKTWSSPRLVSDAKPFPAPERGPDALYPAVAVNKDGVVGVSWYDQRETPAPYRMGHRVRFSASLDGGDTWSASVPVTEKNTATMEGLYAYARPADTVQTTGRGGEVSAQLMQAFKGHTAGLAADAGGNFHPLWIDVRTGLPQVWTATVSVKGQAMAYGSPTLASYADVTRDITVELQNPQMDVAKGIISADIRFVNRSKSTIRGPIVLRVISAEGSLGDMELVGSTNAMTRAGATIDGSKMIPAAGLAANDTSATATIRFKVTEPRMMVTGQKAPPLALILQILSGGR
jgi:hypothetical protein